MRRTSRGQVLAFFAMVLPIVLLPVAAYAVDAAVLDTTAASLQAALAQAAEAAADQVDVAVLRAEGRLVLDQAGVERVAAASLGAEEPAAVLDSVVVAGTTVTLVASEEVALAVPLLGTKVIVKRRASARLASGYASPNSHLALPARTFWSTVSGISMLSSSSRQRLGWMNG